MHFRMVFKASFADFSASVFLLCSFCLCYLCFLLSDEAKCALPKAIFFLILVRHVPHKNEDKYHVSRVWARIKHGDNAQQPLATWTERSLS